MNSKSFQLGIALFALLVSAGCRKKTETTGAAGASGTSKLQTADLVPANERSRHFAAVSRQLELGGTLYGYVEVDGDVHKVADRLGTMLEQISVAQPAVAPFAKQDYGAIFGSLGLDDVKAMGMSSVPDGTGFFRNRIFFYTPDGRHGLLTGFGGRAGPFTHVDLAPADADVYVESEIDVPAVYKTVREVVSQVGGDTTTNLFESSLKKAGESVALSVLNLINDMKGRAALVVRFEDGRSIPLPGLTLPGVSMLVCVDGIGATVETSLARSPLFVRSDAGSVHLYQLKQPPPLEGIRPVVAIDGTTFYFASSPEFLDECRSAKSSLATAELYQQALAHVGNEGNGLTYVSPKFFQRLRSLETLNPNLPPQAQATIHSALASFPTPDRALITVRTNLPDGILVRSYWDRSLKQNLALVTIYNPVTIGLFAAMAIPAFQKVRASSQEKAVLNNLRQLSAAADQYYLERGRTNALFSDLVGPGKYIRAVTPIMGEKYELIIFRQGRPVQIRLPDGRLIEYRP